MANILVIDDASATLERVRSPLEGLGHVITEASSGEEAAQLAGQKQFNLVIIDANLSGANELVRSVRSLPGYQFVPVLGIGMDLSEEEKEAGADAGITGWVAKPVDGDELCATVKAVLG